jgi:hypothetical protein
MAFFHLGQGDKILLRFLQIAPARLGGLHRLRINGFKLGNQ